MTELEFQCLNADLKDLFGMGFMDISPVNFSPVDGNHVSITIAPIGSEVFSLAPPLTGHLKMFTDTLRTGIAQNTAVWRYIVPYTLACNMRDNKKLQMFHMSMIINAGLRELTYMCGSLKGRQILLADPRTQNILRQNENYAGYEVRLYVPESEGVIDALRQR